MAPSVWYETFDAAFWLAIAGSVFAFLGVVFKSKCTHCSFCWGGVIIERDVQAEIQSEKIGRQTSSDGPPSLIKQRSFTNNNNEIELGSSQRV